MSFLLSITNTSSNLWRIKKPTYINTVPCENMTPPSGRYDLQSFNFLVPSCDEWFHPAACSGKIKINWNYGGKISLMYSSILFIVSYEENVLIHKSNLYSCMYVVQNSPLSLFLSLALVHLSIQALSLYHYHSLQSYPFSVINTSHSVDGSFAFSHNTTVLP